MVTNVSEFVGQVLLLPVPSPIQLTSRNGGEGDPKDARLGTSSLARVFTVASRDPRSHRVLLVSHAWQKTSQGILG